MKIVRNIILTILLTTLFVSIASIRVQAETAVLSIAPKRIVVGLNQSFGLDVDITDVFDMYGYQFRVFYNTTMLTATDMRPHEGTTDEGGLFHPTYQVWQYLIDDDPWANATGYVSIAVSPPMGTTKGKTGSGTLADITFNATAEGRTNIWIVGSKLTRPDATSISYSVINGVVTVGQTTQIPVAEAGGPYIGAVNVPVTLNGTMSEDPDGTIEQWNWEFGDGENGTGAMVEHTYSAIGNYTALLTVVDNDGFINVDDAAVEIVVDSIPPTGSIRIAKGKDYVNSTNVDLSISAYDAASGVGEMRFSNDNATWSSWVPYATSKTWDLSSGDGLKTVYCQFKDKSNIESLVYKDTATLDMALPAVTNVSPSDGSEVKSGDAVVGWAGTDEGSGIDHFEVRIDGGSWTHVGITETYTFADLAEGSHTADIKAYDKAGNSKIASVDFVVNLSPIGGPGYMEEIAIAVGVIAAIAVVVLYLTKFRKKK